MNTDWNHVSYNLIILEDASISNYVISIVAWDINHLFMKNYRYEQQPLILNVLFNPKHKVSFIAKHVLCTWKNIR